MSNTQEFYVRKADEADARGPFNLEQLSTLAENGQIDPDTYYYDAATEAWVLISSNGNLMTSLFPSKKTLRIRPKTAAEVKTLNTINENDRPITVNDMLAAAEGRTEDTKDKADPRIAQARAAMIGNYSAAGILLVLTLAFILPSIDILLTLDWVALSQTPTVILGVLNAILFLCLALGATSTYPTVRFAAALNFGLLGTLFYMSSDLTNLGFMAAASIGLYFCTLLLNLTGVLIAALVGFTGAIMLAYHYFTT